MSEKIRLILIIVLVLIIGYIVLTKIAVELWRY